MKKSKKIMLGVCTSSIALVMTPFFVSLAQSNILISNKENNSQTIINKEIKEYGGGNSLPSWKLRVESEVVSFNDAQVLLRFTYHQDQPKYHYEKSYWEISRDKRTWEKITWFTESQNEARELWIDRYTVYNYYVRKVVVWQHDDWWDPVVRKSDPIMIRRRLSLSGKTMDSTDEYVDYRFTLGFGTELDRVSYRLYEIDEKGQFIEGVCNQNESMPSWFASKVNDNYEYAWSLRIKKKSERKLYKLHARAVMFQPEQNSFVIQENYLIFDVMPTKYQEIKINIKRGKETNDSMQFGFFLSYDQIWFQDLISYKIVEETSNGDEQVIEEMPFKQVETFTTQTPLGFMFIKTFSKKIGIKSKYKLVMSIKRTGINTPIRKAECSFEVNEIPIPNKKVITTRILKDQNKIGMFLASNGGYSRENIERINKLTPKEKLVRFMGILISNPNVENVFKEFENIHIYFSIDKGAVVTIGVIYFLKKGYVFEDLHNSVTQIFYDVEKWNL